MENEVSAIALEARAHRDLSDGVEVHALRGVEVDFREGELIVLLGPSGSGKSTLLSILGGLDTPTSGTVKFRGQLLTMDSERALNLYRRNHVGFVFQFYNLIPSLTARENVSLVTEIARNPMSPVEALSIVGLGDRLDHFPAQLSGGEQQRVATARAIAKRLDLLLCDEPTGALDSKTGILVLEAILKINRELGTTTALITHNAVIAEIANRSGGSTSFSILPIQRKVGVRSGMVTESTCKSSCSRARSSSCRLAPCSGKAKNGPSLSPQRDGRVCVRSPSVSGTALRSKSEKGLYPENESFSIRATGSRTGRLLLNVSR